MSESTDTIAAIATPPGRGGVGIIRLSGPKAARIGEAIIGKLPKPRYATLADFCSAAGEMIDHGLALYFPAPNSFTGEDVIELQAHGGPVVLDMILKASLGLGARMARPGEFSERAFHNDKLDLAQAEAIADLIDSNSETAARAALRSLDGEFSNTINQLLEKLIHLRMYVESAIDFPEEEIDFLSDGKVEQLLNQIHQATQAVFHSAKQGSILCEGITLVIAGKPNAGKSSLMNRLAKREAAIVTNIPGTTRDVLREAINLDGIPLHLVDTAGLRESDDIVEQQGIERARKEIEHADIILHLIDCTAENSDDNSLVDLPENIPCIDVYNKIDIVQPKNIGNPNSILVSAKTGDGLLELQKKIKTIIGINDNNEGLFSARRRHLNALERTLSHIETGRQWLNQKAGELLAEELKIAQDCLSEITGEFTSDDLLGEIFSSFCVGK
ncbi:MAG: tRNA uridine-5-carboxymethylaminomethyl(34) synthesis GTPase MnmE [Gammaproteobacteria bacterium]|nr:tRNA uridine-5-carboxymethylaminomethyl(34) synthesis GTPase MnmE [Beggiatoa alba]PCH59702.1 MAG: tRNA uridine-5-carboxymethylaminomethyl(34) synthesis GTPase MnmE [Gammaproteobacteria bacterium]